MQQKDIDLRIESPTEQPFMLGDDVEALQVLARRLDAQPEYRRRGFRPVGFEPRVAQAQQDSEHVRQGFVTNPGPFAGIPVFRLLEPGAQPGIRLARRGDHVVE